MTILARPDHGDHEWVLPRRANNPFMARSSARPICRLCGIPAPTRSTHPPDRHHQHTKES